MDEYENYETNKTRVRTGTNPIWRGIGCILMIVVPIVTYWLTLVITPSIVATGLIPQELLGRVQFPGWVYSVSTLSSIASYLSNIDYFWIKLVTFFILFSVVTGIFSFVYSIIYQLIGPPRYTVLDAPPSRHKPKAYKR